MANMTLGINLESKSSVVTKANTLIKEVQSNMSKLKLDFDSGNMSKTMSELTKNVEKLNSVLSNTKGLDELSNSTKKAVNNLKTTKDNIDNINKSLDNTNNKAENLGKLLSTTTKIKDGNQVAIINKYANSLGEVITKTERLNGEGSKDILTSSTQNFQKASESVNKYKVALAQLGSNGIINKDVLNLISGNLSNFKTNSDLTAVSNSIKTLTSNEGKIISLDDKIKKFTSDLEKLKQLSTSEAGIGINKGQLQATETGINNLLKIRDKLVNGEMLGSNKIKAETTSISSNLRELKNQANDTLRDLKNQANNTTGVFDKLKNALGNVGIVMTSYQVFSTLFNALKDGVKSVIDIENEMISLQRVFPMTTEGANDFKEAIGDMATDLASSSEEMIRTITTFKKLGYSINESKSLAETVTKFNLAGDINNIDEATLDVVSTLKGFKLEAKDVVSVTDQMNYVANNYALTAQDIAEIMKRSSSSLSVSGNTLKESISLGTVAQEVVQDASKVGNALKTISARVGSVKKGELKYAEDLKKIANVDMQHANGDFKSTFEILQDVGKTWDNLDQMQKATIGEDLFGKICLPK